MKQIDEILDNLARSIGSEIEVLKRSSEKNYMSTVKGLYCYLFGYNPINYISTKYIENSKLILLNTLVSYALEGNAFCRDDKKFTLNLEKLIFEPVEEELLPCIYCGSSIIMGKRSYILCDNPFCQAQGPTCSNRDEALVKHNEIYRKVHGEKL